MLLGECLPYPKTITHVLASDRIQSAYYKQEYACVVLVCNSIEAKVERYTRKLSTHLYRCCCARLS